MSFDEKYLSVEKLLGKSLNHEESKIAPDKIYFKGQITIPLSEPRVSIIGSRNATDNGISNTKLLSKFLARQHITIVSGLANGIDTIAHKTSIDNGGKTIAVLATPLDKTYPRTNNLLQQQIMNEHLAISQYPIGHPITRQNFILRNITMALISNATIIMEAKDNSGTRHQAWATIRLNHPLFIWESVFDDEQLELPKKLSQYGAMKLSNPEDILEHIPTSVMMSV